jgi:S-(hydroxymethyl)glutathione dehydrogenase/alcohol dehydrogenase
LRGINTRRENEQKHMKSKDTVLSRRRLLKQGLAASGAALAGATGALGAQSSGSTSKPAAPGRRFRAWVSKGSGPGRTTLEELTLRPIGGRQVLVRTEATNLCYSNSSDVLGLPPPGFTPPPPDPNRRSAPPPANDFAALARMPLIQGHGGVGVVEAVGPEVRRVKAGDRVIVSGTPQCGSCYQCLRGRSDMCQFLGRQGPKDLVPIGDMRDGTAVYQNSHIGGLAELMVTFEEWVVPIFSKAPAAELGMLGCVGVAGLGCTTSQGVASIAPGSSVAVVGCGPVGLSAIQGARIAGATTIVAIEPIRARRELALKVGATHALDPNAEADKLIARVREICNRPTPTDNLWAGGRDTSFLLGGTGADFVVEAVGADRAKPKLEAGPDPTGIVPMRQAYEMCAPGGHIVTTSLPSGNITLPAVLFSIGGRTHHAGQAGGCSPLRDMPRFVEMLDKGLYDAKSLATLVVPIERMLEAYEDVIYRTTVTAIMTA